MNKYVLGIETSCDDTAVALVDRNGNVKHALMASQVEIHNEFGGVFPEFAARAHISSIIHVVDNLLKQSNVPIDSILAIGVTRGPGLIGSLLVGLNTAQSLGLGWGIPVIGINHLRGHLRSVDLEEKRIEYPAIILLVSGGHTFLSYMETPQKVLFLGSTRDDSVGESYDKVARMLELGYPGGPIIDKLGRSGTPNIHFPRPMLNIGFEFSFSGLKAAVSRYIEKKGSIDNVIKEDVAASFIEAALEVLITKSERALKKYNVKSFVVVGGVSASIQLRERAKKMCDKMGVKLCLPPLKWATDNGAMIALATWDYLELDIKKDPLPEVSLKLSEY